jgi:hypothetical protein
VRHSRDEHPRRPLVRQAHAPARCTIGATVGSPIRMLTGSPLSSYRVRRSLECHYCSSVGAHGNSRYRSDSAEAFVRRWDQRTWSPPPSEGLSLDPPMPEFLVGWCGRGARLAAVVGVRWRHDRDGGAAGSGRSGGREPLAKHAWVGWRWPGPGVGACAVRSWCQVA